MIIAPLIYVIIIIVLLSTILSREDESFPTLKLFQATMYANCYWNSYPRNVIAYTKTSKDAEHFNGNAWKPQRINSNSNPTTDRPRLHPHHHQYHQHHNCHHHHHYLIIAVVVVVHGVSNIAVLVDLFAFEQVIKRKFALAMTEKERRAA